jgi:hypothetical protein
LEIIATMKDDVPKLQSYLRKVFRTNELRVVMPPKKKDMAEVYVGDEFVATITVDDEDGERAFQLQMAILDIDLDGA